MQSSSPLDVHSEVLAALEAGRPVVALASVPLLHTLPWPANLETARQLDAVVRKEGALLAVVAVLKGRLTVGLESVVIESLARGGNLLRAGRRDLAKVVVRGETAATTVSSSMYLARRAGIRLLATSAIGGARPQADGDEPFWDISSDLVELLQTPVAVVTAGARSVHHIAYTAEVLETFRVPVIGYGTDLFPIFYMTAGDYPAPIRANKPAEVAALLAAHWSMDGAGVVVAQPTPTRVALTPDELVPALQKVERQMAEDRSYRLHLSSTLMERLNHLTGGKALTAYQAILVANAQLAAQIPRELATT